MTRLSLLLAGLVLSSCGGGQSHSDEPSTEDLIQRAADNSVRVNEANGCKFEFTRQRLVDDLRNQVQLGEERGQTARKRGGLRCLAEVQTCGELKECVNLMEKDPAASPVKTNPLPSEISDDGLVGGWGDHTVDAVYYFCKGLRYRIVFKNGDPEEVGVYRLEPTATVFHIDFISNGVLRRGIIARNSVSLQIARGEGEDRPAKFAGPHFYKVADHPSCDPTPAKP